MKSALVSWAWTWIKVSVSLGLLVLLVTRLDLRATLLVIRSLPWFVGVSAFLLLILGQMLTAWRLRFLLRAQAIRVSYLYALGITLAGLFANNFLPGTIGGDAFKVITLAGEGCGKVVSATSVVLDRLIGIVAIALFFPLVLIVPRLLPEGVAHTIGIVSGGLVLGVGLVSAGLWMARDCLVPTFQSANSSSMWLSRLWQLKDLSLRIMLQWVAKPKILLFAFVLSFAAILAGLVALWTIARSLGICASFVELTAVWVLVYFVTLIPISLNGLGLQEASLAYLLLPFGASSEQALALAVTVRALSFGVSLGGLLSSLLLQGSRVFRD